MQCPMWEKGGIYLKTELLPLHRMAHQDRKSMKFPTAMFILGERNMMRMVKKEQRINKYKEKWCA